MSAEEAPQLAVGQVWRTPHGKRLTTSGIEGDSIDCNGHDPKTFVTDAYVGTRDEFRQYELVSDA
jgi:hypothetical protein